MEIKEILTSAIERKASDIFIVAGTQLAFKVNGNIEAINGEMLTPADTLKLIEDIYKLDNNNDVNFKNLKEDDFSFSLSNIGRFRVNIYRQRNSLASVLRVVSFNLPDPIELHVLPSILDLANLTKGLVLVTGSAGSGKSTTLACIVDEINRTKNNHIITIEDPIEYLHKHRKSIVSQREIGHDTKDYIAALRAALREAPDVILVGEMRDLETVSVALNAAETGHLVLSTLHTSSASDAISRIIDIFPPNQQEQIRVQLTMTLQAVIAQQLVEGKDGKMYPCFEFMKTCPGIRTQIRENKLHLIDNQIMLNRSNGMTTMDDSILDLYKKGIIDKANALKYCKNPETLADKL